MAVLMTQEFEGTPELYDKVNQTMDVASNPPEGLLIHTVQQVGDKMRVVDVWESPSAFEAFAQERLGPAVGEVVGDDAPQPTDPEFSELYNVIKP